MKLKKWVKIVGFILFVIILFFGFLIGFTVVDELKMEQKLNREIEEIQDILDSTDFDEAAYKKKLNKTVTTGNYHKVERAYKNYLKDYLKIENNIIKFYEKLEKNEFLTIDNIKADGKDFYNTRIILNNYSKELETLKEKFDSMTDKKKVLSYLDDNLDEYYVDYYQEIVGDIKQTEEEKELSDSLAASNKLLKNVKATYDFLSEYKNNWQIENNMIVFDSETLLKEYQRLLDVITDLTESTSNNSSSEV